MYKNDTGVLNVAHGHIHNNQQHNISLLERNYVVGHIVDFQGYGLDYDGYMIGKSTQQKQNAQLGRVQTRHLEL